MAAPPICEARREQAQRFGVEVIEMKEWCEPGGFSVRQALAVLQSLTAPLVGADFVEFNPAADRTGVTAAVSAKLVKELAAACFWRLDDQPCPSAHPTGRTPVRALGARRRAGARL